MAKVDFTKVEYNLGQAMYHMFIKKLVQGQTVAYPRAITYFGNLVPKPSPQDSVIQSLAGFQLEQDDLPPTSSMEESEIAEQKMRELISELPVPVSSQYTENKNAVPKEEEKLLASSILILQKRLIWFIRKKVANIYKLLGSTKEEVVALRKKKELTSEELKRVDELVAKSNEIREQLMKKMGVDSDDALVATEKKKHLTKRFNIRDTWLPL